MSFSLSIRVGVEQGIRHVRPAQESYVDRYTGTESRVEFQVK